MPASFDGLARTYDSEFTQSPIAVGLRAKTWQHLDTLFSRGMHVLEIGCGTGEDALHLLQRGIKVTATDASSEMLEVAQQKIYAAGLTADFQVFDLNQPETWKMLGQFDGAYSNFGALNCTSNWKNLAEFLVKITAPHAVLAFGVMGRFCLWETFWHGLHLDWRTATRRWSGKTTAVLPDGSTFPVFYPSPTTLSSAFLPEFTPLRKLGIGTFLPPSDIYPVIEKRPKGLHLLNLLENHFSSPYLADHYWLELQKS